MRSSTDRGTFGRLSRWVSDGVMDLRLASRRAHQHPIVTIAIVASLAFGVGANIALVGAIKHVLLRPAEHVREPERVVRLLAMGGSRADVGVAIGSNYPTIIDLRDGATSLVAIAGYASRQLSLGTGPDARVVDATLVSPEYFSLLGVQPFRGRLFSHSDGFPSGTAMGGPPLAVLSHRFWSESLGGDEAVLGRVVRIGSLYYTITGILPSGFTGAEAEAPDVWLPIHVAANDPDVNITLWDRSRFAVAVVARLHPSASAAIVEQQVTSIWTAGHRAMGSLDTLIRVEAAPLLRTRGPDAPREIRVAVWLAALSTLVLLIACASVANILLARAVNRRQEIAVRLAIGAGRTRIARQLLAEGLFLASIATLAAIWIGSMGGGALRTLLVKGDTAPFVDMDVLILAGALCIGTATLISLASILQSLGRSSHAPLRVGLGTSAGRSTRNARLALVGTQSALCMGLLLMAGLFALSFRRATSLDLGIDPGRTLRAHVNLDALTLPQEEIQSVYQEMLRRLQQIENVESASLASNDPYRGGRAVAAYTPTRDADEIWRAGNNEVVIEASVGARFFHTVDARSLRGRDFTDSDDRAAPLVAVVNAPLARILYPGQDALGKCIILPQRSSDIGDPCVTIVGVLGGVWYGSISRREKPIVYIPIRQKGIGDGVFRPRSIFVRVRVEPRHMIDTVRTTLQSVRSDLPAVRVTPVAQLVEAEIRPWALGATLFGLFGVVALIVAVVGLYGVVSFTVAQQSLEISVRLALGARRRDIAQVVATATLAAVAAGVVIGAGAIFLLRHHLQPLLFDTSALEPIAFMAVAATLLSTAIVAVLVPLIAALRLQPAAVLRQA
jgi:putative ABC transport system permease protein